MVFAPARAKDVADFFGTEKNKVLKNKKQESADEVEDLDGEPWDENEGWGEEWGEQEWEGWGGSTDEFDWEAAYPGFWDDYWQHKYGVCLGAKPEELVDGQEQAQEQALAPASSPEGTTEGAATTPTGPGAPSTPAVPAQPEERTTEGAPRTPGPAEPEEATTEKPASTPTKTSCMPHDPSQADTQPLDTESLLSPTCI